MTQSPSISGVSDADIPVLADYLYTSKLSLAINRFLFLEWPNEATQRDTYTAAIQGSLDDPTSKFLKAVDDATGEILGFVVLTRKHPQVPSDGPGQNPPASMRPEVFRAVVKGTTEVGRAVQDIDRYEITYIYVKPSSRRSGIGSMLLEKCKDRARDAGLPICTQTEPAGYQFFLKHGFSNTKHWDFDLSKWSSPNSGFGIFRLAGIKWTP